ncbi:glycoside hydrolase family 57 protein [Granulicella cerasi]|uniref:Glycoside hydrolase family 57 protein n=1 Tax=Granulicella cerasi TaxID=741063 RepID=A0ABW1Z3R9_9BACT|nr:1,4-alpha-glucan branching protein domain-containing protein [Granulicella cerasi]
MNKDKNAANTSKGFLSFTLHAHLPFVVNHGTWPHGLEWLLEAAAETYLPLLRVLTRLETDSVPLHCNLNLSPVLLEQLSHPAFKAELPRYIERKITAAREDEGYFLSTNEQHYAYLARLWQQSFTQALEDFQRLNGDIVAAFRGFEERGQIEILTTGASHGYLPLLGTDESVRAQVRLALDTHERHLGRKPRGIWIPECGYRPAGEWSYPVRRADGSELAPAFNRIGIEQAISEAGIDYFFVDTHMVEGATTVEPNDARRAYQPYFVEGPYTTDPAKKYAATVFPRDPHTGAQVWSGEKGYPGDPNYLDFHKKRWPGGHRYWSVTGWNVPMDNKQPYVPEHAAERVRSHAEHFVGLVLETLQQAGVDGAPPPIVSAPFDAELFGHWWYEGPQWLEAVARLVHQRSGELALCTASQYLDQAPRAGFISLPEGSWGAHGNNDMWLNDKTTWTYSELYAAELAVREFASAKDWQKNEAATRVLRQLCRELLLLESSDWQFNITTEAAQDYASARFRTHADTFAELRGFYDAALAGSLTEPQLQRLSQIETRDSIFANIDPTLWATGAHANRTGKPTVTAKE